MPARVSRRVDTGGETSEVTRASTGERIKLFSKSTATYHKPATRRPLVNGADQITGSTAGGHFALHRSRALQWTLYYTSSTIPYYIITLGSVSDVRTQHVIIFQENKVTTLRN